MAVKIINFDGQRTDEPGFYLMTAAQYHADPCLTPSLSSSIAKVLLRKTPRHAFAEHPRYTPPKPKTASPAMALGTVVHELVLGKGGGLVVVEADDWRTKAAQAARDAAIEAGKTAVLIGVFDEADKIAERIRMGLEKIEGARMAFEGGISELVAIWREKNGAMCRAMLDHVNFLDCDKVVIDDLKTSGDDIGPETVGKKIANLGYEVSAAFYERGVRALIPKAQIAFGFVFVETDEPYEVLAVTLDGEAREIGRRQVCAAINVWRRCQLSGEWPGFPREVVRAGVPEWHSASWMARETNDPMLEGVDYGA